MKKLYLTFTLMIFALIAVGCNGSNQGTDTPTDEPEPATTTPSLAPPTPEPTFTPYPENPLYDSQGEPIIPTIPVVIDPAAAIPHLSAGEDVTITYIDMQTKTTGWALGGQRDPGDHVLRTTDGGLTWADVTPPEPAPTGGDPTKIAHAFFMDADSAWVTYSFDEFFRIPKFPLVWYTHDGGVTWEHSAYLDMNSTMEFYAPFFLIFSDAQNGWLLVAVGAGMSHSYSLLFRTSDGGATWVRIIDPMTSVDLHNCCKTGMIFSDMQTGLLTQGQGPYTGPFVIWTRDGGLTWLQQPLPDPVSNPNLFDDAFCEVHSPHIFDTNAVLVGVYCKQYGDDGEDTELNYVYTSLDDGATWFTSPAEGNGELFFFDEYTGFIFGRDIYFTDDGGLTWELVKTVNWDGQFSFVNRDTGWVVARNADEIAFLSTVDGGKTWQEIEPVIVE
jgi:photosystem II stability/assembly factor-like uncharacterized protein